MELNVVIARDVDNPIPEQGTKGYVLIKEGDYPIFYCKSLELPWRNNESNISCLPSGSDYELIWCWSNRFKKNMYLIKENIQHRSGFRVHSGAWAGDKEMGFKTHSAGCPLLGRTFGKYKGQLAIFNSKVTVKEFEYIMAGRSAPLIIKEV